MNKTTKKLILFLLVFNFVFALLGMKVNDVKAEGLEVIKTHTGSDLTYRGSSEKVYKLSEYNYPTNQLRAVWVTVFAGDISRYTSETQFKQMMNNVLDDMDKMGMNAIVFHVRTHNNALYHHFVYLHIYINILHYLQLYIFYQNISIFFYFSS